MANAISAWLGVRPEDYARLGIEPGAPALREDGLRTTGAKGDFEWWYFDSKLQNGGSLVIVFYTKPMMAQVEGFQPQATVEYTDPAGVLHKAVFSPPYSDGMFAMDRCDVRMGPCYFRGDLHSYEIYYKDDGMEAKVSLTGNVPAWRPHTGHIFFGEKDYFAWLPAVPEGSVDAAVTYGGKTERLTGTGYHDHNWGNVMMPNLMHHWYWGRAKVGDYVIISSYITAREKYGYEEFPVYLLAKNGEIISDERGRVAYAEEDPYFEEATGKHVYNKLTYDYQGAAGHYRITYRRRGDLSKSYFSANAKGFQGFLLRLIRYPASYQRIQGECTVERLENGAAVETVTAPAIWEHMYFGKDRVK